MFTCQSQEFISGASAISIKPSLVNKVGHHFPPHCPNSRTLGLSHRDIIYTKNAWHLKKKIGWLAKSWDGGATEKDQEMPPQNTSLWTEGIWVPETPYLPKTRTSQKKIVINLFLILTNFFLWEKVSKSALLPDIVINYHLSCLFSWKPIYCS